jgi:hypothetical protein
MLYQPVVSYGDEELKRKNCAKIQAEEKTKPRASPKPQLGAHQPVGYRWI